MPRALVIGRSDSGTTLCLEVLQASGATGVCATPDLDLSQAAEKCDLIVAEARDLSHALEGLASIASSVRIPVIVMLPQPPTLEDECRLIANGLLGAAGPDRAVLAREVRRALESSLRRARLDRERVGLLQAAQQQDRLSALGLLAAGMGHEINNPMTVVTGTIGGILADLEELAGQGLFPRSDRERALLTDWREGLGDCLGAMRRVADIVSSLRAFSVGGSERQLEPVDLNAIATTVARLARKELVARGARLELALSPQLPQLLLCPSHVYQVTMNLVLNAAFAIGQTGRPGRITLRTEFDDDNVAMRVSDDGTGIPPELVDRIFDPFFTTKLRHGGSGLGLFISQSLVRQMQGDIILDNHPGQGATFLVAFERGPAQATARTRPPGAPEPAHRRARVGDERD